MKSVLLGGAIAVFVLSVACGQPAGNSQFQMMGVANLVAPATVAPGASLTVTLTTTLINSCTSFDHISAIRFGSQIALTMWGVDHGALPCIAPHTDTESYQLKPPFPSTFTIVVAQPPGDSTLAATVSVR